MQKEGINYLLVGVFVLLVFALLLALLFRITGRADDRDDYYVHYQNITGVAEGTAVTYGGYQVGQVDEITPVREAGTTHYRLRLAVRSGWRIPVDSVARIVSPGLLSDNQIDIVEGNSEQILGPGDRVRGQEEISMMSLLNAMAYEIQELSDDSVRPLLQNLNRQVQTLGTELNQSLPRLGAQAESLLRSLNRSAEGLQNLFGPRNQDRVSRVLDNAERMSANLAQLSERFDSLRDELEQLVRNSNAMLDENRGEVRQTVTDLRKSLDTVARNIDAIVYNLDSSSRNMNEFSREIRRNPGILLTTQPADEPGIARP